MNSRDLTITAESSGKTYGQTVSFAGTEFTSNTPDASSGLVNGDTIASVSLASPGAAATAHVSGSPYTITASAAVGGTDTDLADYDISYVTGALTVNSRDLTITAESSGKTYGQAVTFAGTEFTSNAPDGSSGLVNGDTIASVTLSSPGAAATAHVSGSPYTITASAAVGGTDTDLADYDISYITGALTVNSRDLTITAESSGKTYGQTVSFAGTEFTSNTPDASSGLVNGDTIASVSLASPGAAATAHVSGSPYTITATAAVAGTDTDLTDYDISYVTAR